MRVGYVLNTYPSPSHTFIRREIAALERRGIHVHRFALRRYRGALPDPADQAEIGRTEVVLEQGAARLAGPALSRVVAAPGSLPSALRLTASMSSHSDRGAAVHLAYLLEAMYIADRCRALGIGHLHAHFGTNSAAVAMLVSGLGGPSYSFTVHGPEEFDAPVALMLAEKARRARFVAAVSSFGRSQLCRWLPFEAWDRITVVRCGIEARRYAEAPAIAAGPLRLVTVGRFVEQKGQLLLLEAFARAQERRPALRLTLVGDGPLRGQLGAVIGARGLAAAVRMTGWTDERGVRAEVEAAQVLVMPSFAEGLPLAVIEAMASARPVIASTIAGIPELVVPGETGWLVPAGDAEALAGAIDAAAATPIERLQAMGSAGREQVLARHDIDAIAGLLAERFRAG